MFVVVRMRLAAVPMGLMRMLMRLVLMRLMRMRLALYVRIVMRVFLIVAVRVPLFRLRVGLRQMAVHQYMDLGATDPAAVHPFDPQACSYIERSGCFRQHLGRNPGIHQRPQQHVARDPGKTVNVRNAHKFSLLELYRIQKWFGLRRIVRIRWKLRTIAVEEKLELSF